MSLTWTGCAAVDDMGDVGNSPRWHTFAFAATPQGSCTWMSWRATFPGDDDGYHGSPQ